MDTPWSRCSHWTSAHVINVGVGGKGEDVGVGEGEDVGVGG